MHSLYDHNDKDVRRFAHAIERTEEISFSLTEKENTPEELGRQIDYALRKLGEALFVLERSIDRKIDIKALENVERALELIEKKTEVLEKAVWQHKGLTEHTEAEAEHVIREGLAQIRRMLGKSEKNAETEELQQLERWIAFMEELPERERKLRIQDKLQDLQDRGRTQATLALQEAIRKGGRKART